jgi:hypothetical protein
VEEFCHSQAWITTFLKQTSIVIVEKLLSHCQVEDQICPWQADFAFNFQAKKPSLSLSISFCQIEMARFIIIFLRTVFVIVMQRNRCITVKDVRPIFASDFTEKYIVTVNPAMDRNCQTEDAGRHYHV